MSLRRSKMSAMWVLALAVLLSQNVSSLAAERTFQLGGQSMVLEDVSDQAPVYFRSMRLNRVLNVWNVEATVTNLGGAALNGPLVLLVESFTNTSGLLVADGSADGKSFLDLSAQLGNGALSQGEGSVARTLTLGRSGTGAPSVVAKVFARLAQPVAGLQVVRTLDDAGLPLPLVNVDSPGAPSGTVQTDGDFGLATLTQTNQTRALRFSVAGYLPVWRAANVSTGAVGIIPNPRLTRRDVNPASFTPIGGGELTRGNPAVQVKFTPGAFSQDTTAVLTPLTGQTLPLFLPQGWSPLGAFWLELSAEPALVGNGTLTPSGPIPPSETAAFVRLNTNTPAWEVLQLVNGNGTNTVNVSLPGSGAYALVVPDAAPIAPPNPTVGGPLPPSVTPLADAANLLAGGTVVPSSSPASRVPELVTATAEVLVTNLAGNLPSGTLLRGEVSERYTLRDGTRRFPALFDNFVVGYQRPGDTRLDTVRAEFPIRPLLLFGAEELDEAVVHMDLFASGAFSGGILDTNGGQVASEGLRVLAGLGDLSAQQAVQLKRLNVTNFTELAGSNATVVAAFDLGVNGIAAGRKLVVQLTGLATNANFVLARVLARSGLYGLEPRERLHSDATGNLVGDEPASGEKLPGLNGAGQYVLLKINPLQGLVSGVARNSTGQPTGGLPVRITGQPWLTFSANDGAFKLLAPTGDATLTVTDLVSGDSGAQTVNVPNPQTPVNTQLSSVSSGPRVASVTPTNNATGVSRVTPIVITFSEPVNPGTVVGTNIQLLGTNGTPVTTSLTLNLKNTIATLLPANPLSPSAQFTIQVSTNVTDGTGLRLEGANQFTFTTESDALNRAAAQLIIYEPTNGVAPVFGTPGTADPESPVILVNETSGQTATILSRADGSFTNLIAADTEDFISAVLINRNGTRTTLPASRQIFRDGSVGLFNGGGILEAQSDAGPVQVIVEPGAIPVRTKFRLESISITETLTLMSNTPPESGTLLGRGIKIATEGDAMTRSFDISIPVTQAELEQAGVTNNATAEESVYALVAPTTLQGDPVYVLLDKMQYENGRLVTHSEPFPGANLLLNPPDEVREAMESAGLLNLVQGVGAAASPTVRALAVIPILLAIRAQPVLFAGRVIEITVGTNGQPTAARTLGGAVVTVRPVGQGLFTGARPGRLDPGSLYTLSKANGSYAFMQSAPNTGNPFDPSSGPEQFALTAQHPSHFGQRVEALAGARVATVQFTDLIFLTAGQGFEDRNPPRISLTHSPLLPAPGSVATVTVLANHNSGSPLVQLSCHEVTSLNPAITVTCSDVTITPSAQQPLGPTTTRFTFSVSLTRAARLVLRAQASALNVPPTDVFYEVLFGGSPVVLPNPAASDFSDQIGPHVVRSQPQQDPLGVAVGLGVGEPIIVEFSEAIDRSVIGNLGAIQLSPSAGTPVVTLSSDQRILSILYYNLAPGQPYALTLSGAITDISPARNSLEPFILRFKAAPRLDGDLSGIAYGGGAVMQGIYAYTLERAGPLDGAVVIYDLSDPTQPAKLSELSVPGFPRDLALLPRYSFVRRPGDPVETKDLLAVVGGKLGGSPDQFGNLVGGFQFLWIIDVSNPAQPVRLASAAITLSASTAVTKIQWSPPNLAYLESAADLQVINLVNLQSFILGSHLAADQFGTEINLGRDENGDGDFVDFDLGDLLPIPSRSREQFAGHIAAFPIDDTNQRILDFDFNSEQGFLGVVVSGGRIRGPSGNPTGPEVPPAYRTLFKQPLSLSRETASFNFTNASPKRLFTLFGAAVTVTGQVQLVNLALVSLEPTQPGPASIEVLNISDPTQPTRIQSIPIAEQHGLVQSIIRRDDGLLMLATSQDILLLDPTKLSETAPAGAPHPAIVGIISGMGSGARSFAGMAAGLSVVNLGGKHLVRQTPPRLAFVFFPNRQTVVDPASLQNDPAAFETTLAQGSQTSVLVPARFTTITGVVDSTLSPPSPLFHYHVLVAAPGSAGNTIELAVETLNEAGFPLRNKGLGFPPVRAMSESALQDIGQVPRALLDAEIHSLTAYRVSTNKSHPLYNLYLSKPFALTYEPMVQTNLDTLKDELDREILFTSPYVRVYLDPQNSTNPVVGSFAGVADSFEQFVRPGPSATALSFGLDYIMGPNPPWPLGWAMIPRSGKSVASHSGEFRTETVDIALPSRRMPIIFARTSGSQDLFDGPFGRGWDFNYNQRLIRLREENPQQIPNLSLVLKQALNVNPAAILAAGQIPKAPQVLHGQGTGEIGNPEDLLFYTGAARVLVYSFAGTNPPSEFASDPLASELGWLTNGAFFFHSPPGAFDMVVQFKDKKFARLMPDGTQFWYTPAGRLECIYHRYTDNLHVLRYNAHGELTRIEDRSVNVDRYLDLGYYRPFGAPLLSPTDKSAPAGATASVGKIARLRDHAGRDVLFHYDENGTLGRREGVEVTSPSQFRTSPRQQTLYTYGQGGGTPASSLQNYPKANYLSGIIGGDPNGAPLVAVTQYVPGAPVPVVKKIQGASGPVELDILYGNTAADLVAGGAQVRTRTPADSAQSLSTLSEQGYPTTTDMSGPVAPDVTYSISYNEDGLPQRITYPLSNSVLNTYELNPLSRRNAANLRFVDRFPHGAGPTLSQEFRYENRYNLRDGPQVDVNGNTITYALANTMKDVGQITYPSVNVNLPGPFQVGLGATEEFEYNTYGQLERQDDANGIIHRSEYDSDSGFLTASIEGEGADELRTTFTYDGPAPSGKLGLPGTRRPPRTTAEPTTLKYDERMQLFEVRHDQSVSRFEHDDNGRVRQRTVTVDNNKTLVERLDYDHNGFLSRRTLDSVETGLSGSLAQLTVEYKPDAMSRVMKIIYNPGSADEVTKEFFNYDHLGRPERMKLGQYEESYVYDDNNNRLEVHRGNAVTRYAYDGHDRLVTEFVPVAGQLEEQVTRGYFNSGAFKEVMVKDAHGSTNRHGTFHVDALQRSVAVVTKTDAGTSVELTRYDANARTRQIASPAGEISTITYNSAGQPGVTSNSVRTVEYTLDKNNNLEKTRSLEGPNRQRVFTTENTPFDDLNRSEQLKDDEGIVSRFTSYRLDGKLLAMRDGRNLLHEFDYTRLGEPALRRRPSGVEFRHAYDHNRNPKLEADAQDKGWQYDYDDTLRLERHTLRDGKAYEFTQFDERSRPRRTEYPKLNPDLTIDSGYDLQGRLITNTVSYLGHVRTSGYAYDGLARPTTNTFTTPTLSGKMTYHYHLLGPVRQVDTQLGAHSFVTRYDVRQDGVYTNLVYPTVSVTEERDLSGRLLSVRPSVGDPVVSSTTFETAKLIGSRVFGNGSVVCTNEFDGRQRLLHRRYTGPGGQMLAEIRYSYDSNNNVVARQSLHRSGRTEFFKYDPDNRLIRADIGARPGISNASPRQITGFAPPPEVIPQGQWASGLFARAFGYDAARLDRLTNATGINPDNLLLPPFASSIGNVDQALFAADVDGFTRTRDSLANTTRTLVQVRPPGATTPQAVGATLQYDGQRQVVRILRDDGVEIVYDYLPSGYCSYRKVTGPPNRCIPSERMFVWDGWRLIEEYDVTLTNKVLRSRYYYTASDVPVAADLVDSGGIPRRHYFLVDMQGSLLALVNGAGAVVERYGYDAWGQPEIEPADAQSPVVRRVVTAADGLLIAFSERVLPPLAPGGSPRQLQATFADFTTGLIVEQGGAPVSGTFTLEESRPGFEFGTVIRFQPASVIAGNLTLRVQAGILNDEWNNPIAGATLNFLFDPTPGTTLFQNPTTTSSALTARTAFDQPFLFHGQYFDFDAGLIYMRARFYDPFTGMFLQSDPAGYQDSVNPYAGLGNNPQSLRDPSGEVLPVLAVVGLAALGGGAFSAAIELGAEDATWGSVGTAFVGGAAAGALTAATAGGALMTIGAGAVFSVGGGLLTRGLNNALDIRETDLAHEDDLARDAVWGGFGAGVGLGVGKIVQHFAKAGPVKAAVTGAGEAISDLLTVPRGSQNLRVAAQSVDDIGGTYMKELDNLRSPLDDPTLDLPIGPGVPKLPVPIVNPLTASAKQVDEVLAIKYLNGDVQLPLAGKDAGFRYNTPTDRIHIGNQGKMTQAESLELTRHEVLHFLDAASYPGGRFAWKARYDADDVFRVKAEMLAYHGSGVLTPEGGIGQFVRGQRFHDGLTGDTFILSHIIKHKELYGIKNPELIYKAFPWLRP